MCLAIWRFLRGDTAPSGIPAQSGVGGPEARAPLGAAGS
jgi:hypothetical protein